jgi:hypothetical protein
VYSCHLYPPPGRAGAVECSFEHNLSQIEAAKIVLSDYGIRNALITKRL